LRPGAPPRYLPGGVRVSDDLIEQAAAYFPEWKRQPP